MHPVAGILPIPLSLHPVILNEVKDLLLKRFFAFAQNDGATWHDRKAVPLLV